MLNHDAEELYFVDECYHHSDVLVAIYMPPRKTPDPWEWLGAAVIFMGLWWVFFG